VAPGLLCRLGGGGGMGEGGARGGASLEEASVGLSARVGKLCSAATQLFFLEFCCYLLYYCVIVRAQSLKLFGISN
jgi:hypothetical protein